YSSNGLLTNLLMKLLMCGTVWGFIRFTEIGGTFDMTRVYWLLMLLINPMPFTRNEGVAGSNPVISTKQKPEISGFFAFDRVDMGH
ncbi:hypothetical protein, partial [Laceyella tengchongensis]|uniref:hypothetical protein n=1 Tax=Laceyella tengchongensis TaxID=574699 RepID=UPI001E335CD4